MEDSKTSTRDPAYIEKKREELKIFFKGINLSQEAIDKAIENELRPLMDKSQTGNKPYIEASFPGEVKSEYEVMTEQPFTKVEDHNKPLDLEEIKKILSNNPVLIDKARQIQIVSQHDRKDIAMPLEDINLDKYKDMRQEIDAAGSQEEIEKINYKHMHALMSSVADFKSKSVKLDNEAKVDEPDSEESDSNEKEFEAIEKVVSQYTNKSYETRFQETKDMLLKMADRYDDPDFEDCDIEVIGIENDHILKDSSVQIIKGSFRQTAYEEIKEKYSINEAMNIPLKYNPVTPNLSGQVNNKFNESKKSEKMITVEDIFPKNLEAKLKDTEKRLRDINSVLNEATTPSQIESNKCKEKVISNPNISDLEETSSNLQEHETLSSHLVDNDLKETEEQINKTEEQSLTPNSQKFDERMEQTLYAALQDTYELSHNENRDNKDLEFKEMKNLARYIVEGAENLSTLIREDITNKLNSMNELLNDVNEALENSKKSNIAYKKIKEESENLRKEREAKLAKSRQYVNGDVSKENSSNVTDSDIDDIYSAIGKLNTEIKGHEDRINKSRENYELRNKECKTFIKEVDDVLLKSQHVLHPLKTPAADLEGKNFQDQDNENNTKTSKSVDTVNENSEKMRKELWDIDIEYKDERNKRLAEFKQQELERNKRINDLLFEIKDKMKDNKEVLKLANNLLRREETRKKTLEENTKNRELLTIETDARAKGDHVRVKDMVAIGESKIPLLSGVGEGVQACLTDYEKRQQEKEKQKKDAEEKEKLRQRQYQLKVERELEEMNRAPRMTKEFIKNHCRQHKLYCTPYLNDILYLHFKGFSKIENLEEYTGLKCIFLENNGIQRIEGLDTLSELKCLYLHYNVVRKIENLDGCPKLDTLNLDHNYVCKIENLDAVPDLHTLSIAHNMLSSVDDLEHLKLCKNLSVLDLSYNRLEDPLIIDVLADMAVLKVLVLTGNPVIRSIPAYRKTLTLRLRELLNLDNRPVFPRDRACAEAWQRGGIDEEIAERRRWIAKDQEKVMQSVRYLIKMRDEKKAIREAKELDEREKLGLPPKDDTVEELKQGENDSLKAIENLSPKDNLQEQVCTKDGVVIDMLTGSEAEDSTSEESSSENSDTEKDETATKKIEWCKVEQGKRLVQEINDAQAPPPPEDLWYGYRGDLKSSQPSVDRSFKSDFQALSNLFFNQQPHTDRKRITEILEDSTKPKEQMVITEITEDLEKNSIQAERKPLIEVIETEDEPNIDQHTNIEQKANIEILDAENIIIDHDRKLITNIKDTKQELSTSKINKSSLEDIIKSNDSQTQFKSDKKPMKMIIINEIPISKENHEGNEKQEVKDGKSGKNETDVQKEEIAVSSSSTDNTQWRPSAEKQGEGISLINYMHHMNKEPCEGSDEDLEPSAEDLELFDELEREEQERQARIARGEPAVDPMKLYDKETMDAFYKAEEQTPAHEVKEKTFHTTYKHDNAFDRIALSQLTAGEKPDQNKVKLTYVPGATLFQYIDHQAPITEVQYEIGEEKLDISSSSPDTESINASSDTDTTSEEEEPAKVPVKAKSRNRPTTASSSKYRHSNNHKSCETKSEYTDTNTKDGNSADRKENKDTGRYRKSFCDVNENQSGVNNIGNDDNLNIQDRATAESVEEANEIKFNATRSSFNNTLSDDRDEAKQSIIDTINSYEDSRFPSQGVNYMNMSENARIENSVATEILDRTLQYQEQEFYRQYDVINSHAGKIDNRTNSIIEHMSEELDNQYTLPEVSRILEVHMDVAEQRWRAGGFVHYIPNSPPESIHDENDTTLIPSHDTSLEDTLTDDIDKLLTINEDNRDGNDNERKDGESDGNKKSDTIVEIHSDDKTNVNNVAINLDNDDEKLDEPINYDKVNESITSDNHLPDDNGEDLFEDCINDDKNGDEAPFNRIDDSYSLEMKLALGIGDNVHD
ncbi:hypothetical protein K1T71_013445 [Dendrolimus kikuchii]|uniref:Uncharacterized protein n=1 Tax=Dendrolimus kikuchii TaxID=765133 RepID=A0ACC1CGG1_9NEOP|nr:hypothetical protein K1T71_013445 [Dendrolimus kikuchii]